MIRFYRSHLIRALLVTASMVGVIQYAAEFHDWIWAVLLALLVGVLSFQLRCLGLRLEAAEGKQSELGLLRMVVLWVAALLMTVWLDEADRGTWREWVGWLLAMLAVLGSVHLSLREWRAMRDCGEA